MELIKLEKMSDYIRLADQQAVEHNHSLQIHQQAVKQAALLYLVDHNVKTVYIRSLTVEQAFYSMTKRDGWTEGKLLTDCGNRHFIISDGINLYSYNCSSVRVTPDGTISATGSIRRRTVVEAHDGRHSLSLDLGALNTGVAATSTMYNTYLIQNLLWNKEARDILASALINQDEDSTKYVVNHKNNDTRDVSADNLELVTYSLNNLHGAFIKMIAMTEYNWLLGKPYYVPKSRANKTGYWKTPLVFKLSAYEVADCIEGNIQKIIARHHILMDDEIVAESDANMRLLTEACDV